MSREFEVYNFDDYTDEQLDDLLDDFTNLINQAKNRNEGEQNENE